MHPDTKYIHALLTNDSSLIKELYEKCFDKIKLMVKKNGGDKDDATDIMQEGLISIYNRALEKNLVLTCPIEAFIYLVCKNKWISEMRKRQHLRKATFADINSYNLKQDTLLEAEIALKKHAQKKLFEEKFAQLGEACKKLLQLNWSGKALDEVAEILQVSYGYVRKKKSECVAQLVLLVEQSPEYQYLK